MNATDDTGTPASVGRATVEGAARHHGSTPGVALRRFAIAVLVGAGVVTAVITTSATAAGDVRTLDLYNVHTKERLTVTFKKGGRFVPSALAELNQFLRDWRRNESTKMDPRLFDTVWELYQKAGSHQPIHVVCGYRALATNNLLRSRSSAVAKRSQHTLGRAMDLNIPDVSIDKLRVIAMKMQNGGVGWYPSANSPFVHIDVGSVRSWPRMPRTQLVRLFPDGKTAHIPADGKPLPGYSQALAEIQHRIGTPPAIAVASAAPKSGGGLLAMLFDRNQEDDRAEIEAAEDEAGAPAAPAKAAPVQVATAAPAKAAPVQLAATVPTKAAPIQVAAPVPMLEAAPANPAPLLLANVPRPLPAPRSRETITSLAEATLPSDAPMPPVAERTAPSPAVELAAVPLPLARPADLGPATTVLAMFENASETTGNRAPLPAARAARDAKDAQDALAEVARLSEASRDRAEFLAYAPQPTATPPRVPSPKPAHRMVTSDPGQPASLTALADPKADMLGGIEAPLVATEDGPSLLDGGQSVYWGHFTSLVHPDQRHLSTLFTAPALVVNVTFQRYPYPDLTSTRFSGKVIAPNNIARFLSGNQLAMR